MIDETKQVLATQYVLGELDDAVAARFREDLIHDEELRHLVSELHESTAEMALSAPPKTPPAEVLRRILTQIRTDASETKVVRMNWRPWLVAASLAVACTLLAFDRFRLHREVVALRDRDTLMQMRIAMLSAQSEAYAKVLAVVVWDADKQLGVVKLEQLPHPAPDKDYQLWVIDPSYLTPVSAGVVNVEDDGLTRAVFRPTQAIRSASKFAVSIERKGGARTPEGQIILVGN